MKKVIFVCLGNICRSPAAEGVMTKLVIDNGLSDQIKIDSAGTNGLHDGENADSRMIKHAQRRGYDLTSISRQIKAHDLEEFDYILAMDASNYQNLLRMDTDKKYRNKILLMTDYCKKTKANGVPDPYYGGDDGFELVLDILEDSVSEFLEEVKEGLS